MATTSETILEALKAKLGTISGAKVARGIVVPTKIPASGLLILRDGVPGEPEVTMSPMTWHFEHVAELEIFASGSPSARLTRFDDLKSAIGTVLAADRTLGGLCDWVEAQASASEDLPFDGAADVKAAILPVVLHYATTDPLN